MAGGKAYPTSSWTAPSPTRATSAPASAYMSRSAAPGKSEHALHVDNRTTNTLIRDLRALGERAAAELKERWRALRHVSCSPSRIGDIARAALVLNTTWK
ncbi:transposase family protein [Streptomyces sp. NPDC056697]|uniref:transposase family protein n=1 Tax=Streptomyces sp. NPDC056697 TaxID=3345915 RepID=UPI0036A21907